MAMKLISLLVTYLECIQDMLNLKAGKLKLKDGMMVMDQKHWKEENGKIMADTGAEGEVFGEKVGPWEELKVVDGSMIEMMMYRLKKAE